MYFGNAVMTTPYTSVKNIVKHEKTGLLVGTDSPKEIRDDIL
jgi:hypothetical protein